MGKFRLFLAEGGNAVEVASRINQRNVKATLDKIYDKILPYFKLSKSDESHYVLLGSAGKKRDEDSSGDLDLAISYPVLMKEFNINDRKVAEKKIEEIVTNIAKDIFKDYGHEGHTVKDFFKLMPGLETFSVAFPIENQDGKQEGEFVQLDIMPSDNIDLVGWGMGAPHYTESEVKGLVRNELLMIMIKYSDMKVLKTDDNGDPVSVKRYYFHLKSGLYSVIQNNKLGKNGKYTKAKEIVEKKLITTDKDKIVQFLFGPKVQSKDVRSFEQAWKLFMSGDFRFPKAREEIRKHFLEAMEKHGIKVPTLG
jgi:hypothetical protein